MRYKWPKMQRRSCQKKLLVKIKGKRKTVATGFEQVIFIYSTDFSYT